MMTAAQRINAAIERHERAIADLLHSAEKYPKTDGAQWVLDSNRVDLLKAARRYANSIAALRRAGA